MGRFLFLVLFFSMSYSQALQVLPVQFSHSRKSLWDETDQKTKARSVLSYVDGGLRSKSWDARNKEMGEIVQIAMNEQDGPRLKALLARLTPCGVLGQLDYQFWGSYFLIRFQDIKSFFSGQETPLNEAPHLTEMRSFLEKYNDKFYVVYRVRGGGTAVLPFNLKFLTPNPKNKKRQSAESKEIDLT